MNETLQIKNEIIYNIENREYMANLHVIKCFSIAMIVYFITFLLNLLDIFIVDKSVMMAGFIPSVIIYLLVIIITKIVPLSNDKIKYFILFCTILVFTFMGVTITYHVVVVALLPISYAILYSSKKVMRYVYVLTVLSTIIVVYAGYYFGLCDANMVLLTSTKLSNYMVNGTFEVNSSIEPSALTLMLFFVIPRCLIQLAFMFVYNSIIRIIEDSLKKAANLAHMENLKIQRAQMEKEKADAANKAKTAFLSNMSHEIRTPMNAIVGITEVLLRREHSKETMEYLNNIKVSGDALLTIINDILDFSKIESGKMDIILDEYEPMSTYQDLAMTFLNRIGEKPVELIYDIDVNLPHKLYGDAQRIRQVIINLMNNAIKFTDKGFVRLSVKVKQIEDNRADIFYSVEDSGQGIKSDDIDKLFGVYQQVDKEKNRYKEGTGLGLAISKYLVEMMGGTIGVESEYGKGSTFYFTIPQEIRCEDRAVDIISHKKGTVIVSERLVNPLIKEQFEYLIRKFGLVQIPFEIVKKGIGKADFVFTDDSTLLTEDFCKQMEQHNCKLCVVQNPMYDNWTDKKVTLVNKPLYSMSFCQVINGDVTTMENEKSIFSFTAPEAKILIVDDNEMNITVAKGLLESLQMNIDTAENGQSAIEKIKKNKYHIVFMDHMMPVMDGIEATKIIREMEDSYYKELPIVALTANATVDARELFAKKGFDDFVSKPIKIKELCACIRSFLPKECVLITDSEMNTKSDVIKSDILDIPGINIQEGIENSGSKELFINLLGDFYKLIESKSNKVENYLDNGQLREYTIEVHALKSTSRMIGAMELSDKFYELEKLGDMEDKISLEKLTPGVLSLYRSYIQILEPFAKSKEQQKCTVTIEDMIETLNQLKNAIDAFDLDEADFAMRKLEDYEFPEHCKLKIKKLSELVADVAMEDVMELTDCLIKELQQ